jgi:hypothetical protein
MRGIVAAWQGLGHAPAPSTVQAGFPPAPSGGSGPGNVFQKVKADGVGPLRPGSTLLSRTDIRLGGYPMSLGLEGASPAS